MNKKKVLAERRKNTPIVKGWLSVNPDSKDGWQLFTFHCPFCRDTHQHGYPPVTSRKKYAEHRAAHCYNILSPFRKTGYYLQPFTAKEIQEMSQQSNNYLRR